MWLDSILHYAFFFEKLFLLVQFFFYTNIFCSWMGWRHNLNILDQSCRTRKSSERKRNRWRIKARRELFVFRFSVVHSDAEKKKKNYWCSCLTAVYIVKLHTHTQTEKTVDFLDLLVVESFSASLRALCISFSSFPLCFIISFFGLMFIFTSSQKKKKMKKKKEKRFPL